MSLAEKVYRVTRSFPERETYSLVQQLRRSAVSVPSNLAEGRGRGTEAELRRFLRISYGALLELETQLELARRLGLAEERLLSELIGDTSEIGRMINGLLAHLTSPQPSRQRTADASPGHLDPDG